MYIFGRATRKRKAMQEFNLYSFLFKGVLLALKVA
jgi:hypothetical protein